MIGTESRIRAAAIRIIAEKGFAGTGIREIADEAGVASSVLYHYIDSKEDLLADIMRVGQSRLLMLTRTALERATDPRDELVILVQVLVTVQALLPLDSKVLDHEIGHLTGEVRTEVVEARDEYEALWSSVLKKGASDGVFIDSDLHLLRLALIQMCNGVAYWYSPSGARALPDIADAFARIALSAAGALQGAGASSILPAAEIVHLVTRLVNKEHLHLQRLRRSA